MLVYLMINRPPSFCVGRLELQGGAKLENTTVLQCCSEMLRAGIRDGDGIKKSGSKHHTKAAPLLSIL